MIVSIYVYLLSSYTISIMGLSGLEPPTSRLSGVRSNQLSYKPVLIWQPPTLPCRHQHSTIGRLGLNHRVRDGNGCVPQAHRHQKWDVIIIQLRSCRVFHYLESALLLLDRVKPSYAYSHLLCLADKSASFVAVRLRTRSLITKQ